MMGNMGMNPMMGGMPQQQMSAPQQPGAFNMGQPSQAPVAQSAPATLADKKNPVAMLAEVMKNMDMNTNNQPPQQQQF